MLGIVRTLGCEFCSVFHLVYAVLLSGRFGDGLILSNRLIGTAIESTS